MEFIGYGLSVVLFLLGWWLGKRSGKNQTDKIVQGVVGAMITAFEKAFPEIDFTTAENQKRIATASATVVSGVMKSGVEVGPESIDIGPWPRTGKYNFDGTVGTWSNRCATCGKEIQIGAGMINMSTGEAFCSNECYDKRK